jgi:hypothetical protein
VTRWRRPARQGDQLGFSRAVEYPRTRALGIVFAGQDGFKTFLDQLSSRSLDRWDAGVQRLGDPAVAPPIASLRNVGFQKNAGSRQQMPGAIALADQRVELTTLLATQPDDVFLDGNLFPGHESPPSTLRDGIDSEIAINRNDVRY